MPACRESAGGLVGERVLGRVEVCRGEAPVPPVPGGQAQQPAVPQWQPTDCTNRPASPGTRMSRRSDAMNTDLRRLFSWCHDAPSISRALPSRTTPSRHHDKLSLSLCLSVSVSVSVSVCLCLYLCLPPFTSRHHAMPTSRQTAWWDTERDKTEALARILSAILVVMIHSIYAMAVPASLC